MRQTTKDRKEAQSAQERARQAGYEKILTSPRAQTWSVRMPPYCYTVLCPDLGLRMHPADVERRRGER